MSIQPLPLGFWGFCSSKPNILQIRVGKVMEKNHRDWSGECLCRKDSTEAQAVAICSGVEEMTIVAARSADFVWASVAYECDMMVKRK